MNPPLPAATAILLRDGPDGLETLLLQRHRNMEFGGGAWVFPGGRVDDVDRVGDEEEEWARRAAVREIAEEAGLTVAPGDLVPFAHWTAPVNTPKRFATWFFVVEAPAIGPDVTVDGGEIVEHVWVRPSDALARHAAGEVELLPPTWMTLHYLSAEPDVATVLAEAVARSVPRYFTKFLKGDGCLVAIWDGDAGYAQGDIDAPGARNRLWIRGNDWRYERTQ